MTEVLQQDPEDPELTVLTTAEAAEIFTTKVYVSMSMKMK
jgi:hypothetical protein